MVGSIVRRIGCVIMSILPLALPGCGRSQEAKVIDAIEAKYPGGQPRCLGLGNLPGVHVAVQSDERLFYPSTGPTAPANHLFILYAARSGDPVPELVTDLAGRGMLTKVTVQATVDAETSGNGPQMVSATGIYFHPTWYAHRTGSFAVDIYETPPFDVAFGYAVQAPIRRPWAPIGSFPSRLYDGPLPPPDRHYAIPTIDPYAVSIATAACFRETIDRVTAIRIKEAINGDHFMEADVLFAEHPAEWMTTAAFRRAAMGPNTDSFTKPRLATVILKMSGDQLAYAYEKGR